MLSLPVHECLCGVCARQKDLDGLRQTTKMFGVAEKQHAVLVTDDNEADRSFLTDAIRRHASYLKVVGELANGEQVVEYLSGQGQYADREKYPFPELLILDVKMPRMTGIEVLEWLRAQKFPDLKVAMLADSSASVFRARAIGLGVDYFHPKCLELGELVHLVKDLQAKLTQGRQQ